MSNFDENPWPTWHKMHTAIELEKSIKKQTKEMNEIKDKFYNHFPQYKEDIKVKVKEDEDKRAKESHHAGYDGDDLLDSSTPSQIQPFMAGPLNSIYARNFGGNCYPPMPNMYMPPQMSMMSGPPYQQPFPPPLQMYQNPYGYGGTSYMMNHSGMPPSLKQMTMNEQPHPNGQYEPCFKCGLYSAGLTHCPACNSYKYQ